MGWSFKTTERWVMKGKWQSTMFLQNETLFALVGIRFWACKQDSHIYNGKSGQIIPLQNAICSLRGFLRKDQPFCRETILLSPTHSVGFLQNPYIYTYKKVCFTPWGEFQGGKNWMIMALSSSTWQWNGIQIGLKLNLTVLWIFNGFSGTPKKLEHFICELKQCCLLWFPLVFYSRLLTLRVCWEARLKQAPMKKIEF